MSEKKEFISTRQGVKYLDLFAGAGGFSEGFMQAYTDDKYYDFRLASDINENCELTHRVRYNKMLGLDTKFVCQDIMDDSFLPNLLKEIGNEEIDVVIGTSDFAWKRPLAIGKSRMRFSLTILTSS